MDNFYMRAFIDNREYMPEPTYVSCPENYPNRNDQLNAYMKQDLILTVFEMQTFLRESVFEESEHVTIQYTSDEVTNVLMDSAVVYVWTHLADGVRTTFATRNVIPISRKMSPVEQSFIVARHIRRTHHKYREWTEFLRGYLSTAQTNSNMDLLHLILEGEPNELESYNENEVTSTPFSLVPQIVAVGYLWSAFAGFFDKARSRYWRDYIMSYYDTDGRYLEQLIHSLPAVTLFHQVNQSIDSKNLHKRVKELEHTIETLKVEHQRQLEELNGVITSVYQQFQPNTPESPDPPLFEGQKIAVAGDDVRHPVYQVLLEQQGARAVCIPGFSKLREGMEQLAHADGVIFVTAYSCHSLYYAMKARRKLTTTVLVNEGGMQSFHRAITELAKKLKN